MNFENNWRDKSISALEKKSYDELSKTDIPIAQRIYEAVKKPVGSLTVEDLRLLVGQQTGLIYLLPLAFEHLDSNILAEGDYYPGDLLENVISIEAPFWRDNPEWYTRITNLIKKEQVVLDEEGIDITSFPNL